MALLHVDVHLRADAEAVPGATPVLMQGVETVARAAMASSARARFTQPALVNGAVGLVMAPRGRLFVVLSFSFADGKIRGIEVIADSARLRLLDLAVLET